MGWNPFAMSDQGMCQMHRFVSLPITLTANPLRGNAALPAELGPELVRRTFVPFVALQAEQPHIRMRVALDFYGEMPSIGTGNDVMPVQSRFAAAHHAAVLRQAILKGEPVLKEACRIIL